MKSWCRKTHALALAPARLHISTQLVSKRARVITTKIQICGFFHQTLLKNEEFLLEEIRVFVPQYASLRKH